MFIAKMICGLVLIFAWIKMIRFDRRQTSENGSDLTW